MYWEQRTEPNMFSKITDFLADVSASNRVAIALKNGAKPSRQDLLRLGVHEDRIDADFS